MAKKVGMVSLGCAKNRVNSEQMMYLLKKAGFDVSGDTDGADAVVINTCGFIESAKAEAVEAVSEMAAGKRAGSIGAIVVAGCLPERHKDDILRLLPEADAVIGTGSFDDIADVVEKALRRNGERETISRFGDIDAPVSETSRIISTSHVWAYLKIAEGCDNRCAYCCIPGIRGRYRSRPPENIVSEAERLVTLGYRELILVAQDTTAYGLDIYGKRSLTELLRGLGKIDKLAWIRMLYMYPDGFDDTLIDEIAKNDRIVKYLDIPIQHINDDILRNMNRRGSSSGIRRLFHTLRERIAGVVLRTSLITGLPGEGADEFEELCDFLRGARIERAGVFPYSPEEGTAAALMRRPGEDEALRRAEIVQGIQAQIMDDFSRSRIGTVAKVIVEGRSGSTFFARSYAEAPDADGYISFKTGKAGLTFTEGDAFADVRLTGMRNGELTGKVPASRSLKVSEEPRVGRMPNA